jgi:(p)ppGpp synthase/HD superfamily hydrolase
MLGYWRGKNLIKYLPVNLSGRGEAACNGNVAEPDVQMIAQTNLQLFAQLHEAAWSADDIAPVRQAYRLAMELFAARFRGNGKPFICHLVGSAAVAAEFGLARNEVAACLLHAAYDQGVFPSGRMGARSRNRKHIRARVGTETEALVHAYRSQPWNEAAIDVLTAVSKLPPTTLTVIAMRLADLLDDLQDAGCIATPGKFDVKARRQIAKAAALAERIGRPEIAARIRSAESENAGAAWVADVVKGQAASFSLKPTLFAVLRAHLRKRHTF